MLLTITAVTPSGYVQEWSSTVPQSLSVLASIYDTVGTVGGGRIALPITEVSSVIIPIQNVASVTVRGTSE